MPSWQNTHLAAPIEPVHEDLGRDALVESHCHFRLQLRHDLEPLGINLFVLAVISWPFRVLFQCACRSLLLIEPTATTAASLVGTGTGTHCGDLSYSMCWEPDFDPADDQELSPKHRREWR